MRGAILAMSLIVVAVPAMAQVEGNVAKRQLFPTRGVQLALSRSLSEQEQEIIQGIVREADRTGRTLPYYGSIAYSPSEGLTAESIQGAFNHHSAQAADAASIAACDAVRKGDSSPCQVAAHILPRGYEPGRLQLSFSATSAFRSTYGRIRSAKALATSESTGAWQMAEGVDEEDAASTAVGLCNDKATSMGGPADCRAVIVN